jgi:hypothetical protein
VKFDSLSAESLAQAIVITKRPVVHETEIKPGAKWMRSLGRHRAFGRHPSMTNRMAPSNFSNGKPLNYGFWQPGFFHDLNPTPDAHDANFGEIFSQEIPNCLDVGLH